MHVDSMKYLGVMVSSDGSIQREIEARIGGASKIMGGMSRTVLSRRELGRQTKLKVVNAMMMPALLYGCETWALHKDQKSKIQAMQMNALNRFRDDLLPRRYIHYEY